LKSALGAAAALPLGLLGARAHSRSQTTSLSVEHLTDSLLLISGSGCNIVALKGPDGVLMVDGGSADRSAEVLQAIEHEFGSAPRILFNTHWHPEHVGCNERVGKAGGKIIAHENTKLWLGTEVRQEWAHRVVEPLPVRARPNSTFYTTGKMEFGGEQIDYGYLGQAHTDGDIYIFFRQANVLVAGDVVSVGSYPILDYTTGGWIGGMTDATQQLVNLSNESTRIIPGTGPVQTRADVVAEQQMLAKVKDTLWQMIRKGFGAEDMIAAAPTKEFDPKWGNPDLLIANAYMGMYGHIREMGGVV
jgi:glyoxylase-like metal-dependent hydrolase (beta-lactamase superfamily II)